MRLRALSYLLPRSVFQTYINIALEGKPAKWGLYPTSRLELLIELGALNEDLTLNFDDYVEVPKSYLLSCIDVDPSRGVVLKTFLFLWEITLEGSRTEQFNLYNLGLSRKDAEWAIAKLEGRLFAREDNDKLFMWNFNYVYSSPGTIEKDNYVARPVWLVSGPEVS